MAPVAHAAAPGVPDERLTRAPERAVTPMTVDALDGGHSVFTELTAARIRPERQMPGPVEQRIHDDAHLDH